jgi:hypothetical protein
LALSGSINETVQYYMGGSAELLNFRQFVVNNEGFSLKSLGLRNTDKSINDPIERDKEILIEIEYYNGRDNKDEGLYFNLKFKDEDGRYLMVSSSSKHPQLISSAHGKATMVIPPNFFNEGSFFLDLLVIAKSINEYRSILVEPDILNFQIHPEQRPVGAWLGKEVGFIRHNFEWR